jgi:hypothetical protein
MNSDKDEPDKEVRAWVDSESVDSAANYAGRGRRFASLSDQELSSAWVQTLKGWAVDIHDSELRAKNRDYDAEFSLRGIEPPYDLVSEAHDLLYTNMQKWMDGLSAEDLKEFSEGVEKHFKEFQAKRDRHQN